MSCLRSNAILFYFYFLFFLNCKKLEVLSCAFLFFGSWKKLVLILTESQAFSKIWRGLLLILGTSIIRCLLIVVISTASIPKNKHWANRDLISLFSFCNRCYLYSINILLLASRIFEYLCIFNDIITSFPREVAVKSGD